MALTVVTDEERGDMVKHINAAKDLYLNADKTKAVLEGPEAAFLLVRKGIKVPQPYVDLVTAKGNPKQTKRDKAPVEDKEAATPAADKDDESAEDAH